MKTFRIGALLLAAALLASCNGSTSGGTGFAPLTGVNTNTTDPLGDITTGATGTKYDILLVQTSRPTIAAVNMTVTITFNQTVNLPPSGSMANSSQLVTLLAFNTTGSGGVTITCGPPTFASYSNVNFLTDGFARLADGNYKIESVPSGTPTGEVSTDIPKLSTTNGLSTIVFTVPLAALGGSSGATQFGIELGNFNNETDCAPNTGTIST
jgi:hypothetical protein